MNPEETDRAKDIKELRKAKYEIEPEKPKAVFLDNFRRANWCSRITYSYSWPLINSIIKNDGKMTEEMIEDMTKTDGETEAIVKSFEENIKKREVIFRAEEQRTGVKGEYYYVLRGAIWDTFGHMFLETACYCFFGETFAIGYTSFLVVLIAFIKNPEAEVLEGIGYLAIFISMMILAALNRNFYISSGYILSVKMRKAIVCSLYSKMSRLSMRSLAETNSGKLVTIVSGDFMALERPIAIVAILFAAPFINLVAIFVIGFTNGWQYAGITFAVWIVIMILQHLSSKKQKVY